MNDNDLEKTMPNDLEETKDLERTMPIENLSELIEEEEKNEEVIGSREEQNNEIYEELEKKEEDKGKIKKWWGSLSKKKKTIFIIIIVLSLLLIGLVVVYFTLRKDNKTEEKKPEVEVEEVILVEDNYIYKDGVLSLLDGDGKEVGTYECVNKDEKLCYVSFNSDEDKFDDEKLVYENGKDVIIRSKIYNNRYVFINDNKENSNNTNLYDMEKKEVVDKYQLVKNISIDDKDYAIVKNDMGLYGVYDFSKDKELIIDFKYDYLGKMNNGSNLVALKDGVYSILSISDKVLAKNIKNEIRSYNDKYIVLYENRSYKMIDYEGKEIINNKADYIKLYDNYFAYVRNNNLYFNNYDGEKLFEEGKELIIREYVDKKIFNEEGKKIKDSKSFSVSLINDNVSIDVYDEEGESTNYSVNLKNAFLSSKLSYYSYYEGKLYFYEDEAKEKLIGSYKCNNENDLSKDDLSTCMIAKDSLYEDNYTYYGERNATIPIINNRFVIVFDSPVLNNDENRNIYIVNLSNGKVMGPYRSVNTHTADNCGVVSHVVDNKFEVMAVNANGKYGMLKIGLTDISGDISFEYDYMEKINKGFAVKKGDAWGVIYNSELTMDGFKGRIMNVVNNYVIAKEDDGVYLYDAEADKVVDKGFDYISVGNKYFGAVSKDKVYVYDFSGKLYNEDGYSLNSKDYLEKVVFKFSSVNGNDFIDILNSDGSYQSYEIIEVIDNAE